MNNGVSVFGFGFVRSSPLGCLDRLANSLVFFLFPLLLLELQLMVNFREINLQLVVFGVQPLQVVLLFLERAVQSLAVAFVYDDILPFLNFVYFLLLAMHHLFKPLDLTQHPLLLLSHFVGASDEAVDFFGQGLSA